MCCQVGVKKTMYHRPVRIFVQVTVGHFNGKLGTMRASGVETRKIITLRRAKFSLQISASKTCRSPSCMSWSHYRGPRFHGSAVCLHQ
ncbi:hypothetical protein HBH70_151800 [Parastagonospora nodorum]|nr:hypothetical protein HBH51_151110 [Parastagonospora nodorum]KAH3977110.1 hypothetical protein HBH52_111430 [Parastagonospora nodorum]KAH3999872.1 hypothetical protein HBI10_110360 [Parastagonospora nodorum]KAH4022152.1 hypothetical protein HBI13_098840 [Parastagonospora nodorum]KAH4027845.1 hypothetical protein HBI09_144000 [Parastagonospora nodorum]